MAAIRKLPAKQRAVLVLRYWDEMSEQEIASALGCSPGTVKTHAARALAALRKAELTTAVPNELKEPGHGRDRAPSTPSSY
jgi:DNA-directed RNA polymerase specialized sigma24 family protein